MIGRSTLVAGIVLSALIAGPVGTATATTTYLLSGDTSLTLDGLAAGDQFGNAVDISGNTVLIGASYTDRNSVTNTGAAHVFVHTGQGWTFQNTLVSGDSAIVGGSRFGESVGLDGDAAVVGSFSTGKAYVFNRSGTDWTEDVSARLNVPGLSGLGRAVAISGANRVLAGGSQPSPGAAVVFQREGTWDEGTALYSSYEPTAFGHSVDMSGDLAVVGDHQANTAYFYRRDGDDWIEESAVTRGFTYDEFGSSVSLDGDYAIVGSGVMDIGGATNRGSASIYHRTLSGNQYVWQEQAALLASDGLAYDLFGCSVAISGNLAVVGAEAKGPYGSKTGAVYVYQRTGETWNEMAVIRPSDGASYDEFGQSVAIDSDWIVVGAWKHDGSAGAETGAAYVFSIDDLIPLLPGDANRDGLVNDHDAAVLAANWLMASGAEWGDGDFNTDGMVDDRDAAILAAHWQRSAEGAAVPEPSLAVLLLTAAAFLPFFATRRRREGM